jgi:hypothetical protein
MDNIKMNYNEITGGCKTNDDKKKKKEDKKEASIKKEAGQWLDGAKFVKHLDEHDITMAWFGGHGIHVFDKTGEEIDFYNTGDMDQPDATIGEIEESIEEYLLELQTE